MSATTTPNPAAPTADQLVAATQPPAAPAELTFQFPDGSVIKGATQQELLEKAAKRYEDSRAEANTIKEEKRALEQRVQSIAQPPAAPAAPGTFDQNKFWELMNGPNPQQAILYALAGEFQTTPDELKKTLENTVNAAETFTNQYVSAQFMAKNPDFPASDPNAAGILVKHTSAMTVEAMEQAHAYCIKNNLYKPAEVKAETTTTTPAAPPVVPPMLNQPAAATGDTTQSYEEMANAMSPAQLRAAIEKLAAGGQ